MGGYLGMEAGSHGVATVSGAGTEWNSPLAAINIGENGTGELSIIDGGSVASGNMYLGDSAPGRGRLQVIGAQSRLKTSQLDLGRDGTGDLTIDGGASVTSGGAWIAGDAPTPRGNPVPGVGNVNISGPGSKWSVNGDFIVCYDGAANVTVTDGAQLASFRAWVGHKVGADGRVTIAGTGSQWTNWSLAIGVDGAATVAVNDGARLTATENIDVGVRGRLTGDGFVASQLGNSGVVVPGDSVGVLNVEGRYTQFGSGQLQIDLASATAFDVLEVTGAASLKGSLAVGLMDGFTPGANDAFEILTTTLALSGRFNQVSLPSLAAGLGWRVEYSAKAVTLRVEEMTADFNSDGKVDAQDLAVWKTAMSGGLAADATGDGHTDGADFLAWQRQLGAANGGASLVEQVPEPAMWQMLLAAALFLRRGVFRGAPAGR